MADSKPILYLVKIGGNIVDDEKKLHDFLADFAQIKNMKLLVHGGGKLATRMAQQLNIPQTMVDGRRITDAETLKVVTMVYAGYINKNIVAQLQAGDCNALGLSGADGNIVQAHKRIAGAVSQHDYGFAGDVDAVNVGLLQTLLQSEITPVLCPITHDKKGQLLNTNADTITKELAGALSDSFQVQLIYLFEKAGVLSDAEDENSVIEEITPASYKELKEKNIVFAGMIPKIDNAFAALSAGAAVVTIGKAEDLKQIIVGEKGTRIVAG
ncbi:MAG: acetylglutamate kinase [Flavisolibacter sp.]